MNAPKDTERRAVWLRSLGWHANDDGLWSARVSSTGFGWYAPMSLDHAFGVALRHTLTDDRFRVEVRDGRVRLVTVWRELAYEDVEAGDEPG
jgi:hypothetical protein